MNKELYLELCNLAEERFNIKFLWKNQNSIEITGMRCKKAQDLITDYYEKLSELNLPNNWN